MTAELPSANWSSFSWRRFFNCSKGSAFWFGYKKGEEIDKT